MSANYNIHDKYKLPRSNLDNVLKAQREQNRLFKENKALKSTEVSVTDPIKKARDETSGVSMGDTLIEMDREIVHLRNIGKKLKRSWSV